MVARGGSRRGHGCSYVGVVWFGVGDIRVTSRG